MNFKEEVVVPVATASLHGDALGSVKAAMWVWQNYTELPLVRTNSESAASTEKGDA